MHERTITITDAAEDHWFARTCSRVLGGWLDQVARAGERRAALRRIFESQAKAERKVIALQVSHHGLKMLDGYCSSYS